MLRLRHVSSELTVFSPPTIVGAITSVVIASTLDGDRETGDMVTLGATTVVVTPTKDESG